MPDCSHDPSVGHDARTNASSAGAERRDDRRQQRTLDGVVKHVPHRTAVGRRHHERHGHLVAQIVGLLEKHR